MNRDYRRRQERMTPVLTEITLEAPPINASERLKEYCTKKNAIIYKHIIEPNLNLHPEMWTERERVVNYFNALRRVEAGKLEMEQLKVEYSDVSTDYEKHKKKEARKKHGKRR